MKRGYGYKKVLKAIRCLNCVKMNKIYCKLLVRSILSNSVKKLWQGNRVAIFIDNLLKIVVYFFAKYSQKKNAFNVQSFFIILP